MFTVDTEKSGTVEQTMPDPTKREREEEENKIMIHWLLLL